ncbi:MAG TPA: hypothetical protein PK413_20610, partial [Thermoanaerobaculia bacterium]|nr:hypothetical protein [Thermoanaerobaculia bacterium]
LRVARFQSGAWAKLGQGQSATVRVLLSWNDGGGPGLYAAGGDSDSCCAFAQRFRAGSWASLSTPPGGRVLALTPWDDGTGAGLITVGASGLINRGVGTSWTTLASLDAAARAVALFDDGGGPALFVGGDFLAAGGSPSPYLARLRREASCPPDTAPPSLTLTAPAPGAFLTTTKPAIAGSYTDAGVGVEATTLAATLGAGPLAATCTRGATSGSCTPSANLAQGAQTLGLTVKDYAGNLATSSVSVTVDSVAPTVAWVSPAASAWLATRRPGLVLSASDATSGVNFATVTVKRSASVLATSCGAPAGGQVACTLAADLPEGAVTLTATVADAVGLVSSAASLSFSIDTTAPTLTWTSPLAGETVSSSRPELRLA